MVQYWNVAQIVIDEIVKEYKMKKQQGTGLIGMLMTIVVVVMVVAIGMRAIPVYFQYYTIVQSIKALNLLPASSLSGDPMADVDVLRNDVSKRLEINDLADLNKDQLIIMPTGVNKFVFSVKYQVIKPLVYNVSLLFDFNKKLEVKIGSEN